MDLPPLILASASPRRAQLLRQLDLEFHVDPGGTLEAHPAHLTPREVCLINACRKARAASKRHPDGLVLGADTVVCLGPRVFGKPRDRAEAARMLRMLQGRAHEVLTGVCLTQLRAHRQHVFAERSLVRFRALTTLDIRRYLSLIDPLDKAGAYAIQEHGTLIVESVEGSISNVIGLPLERLLDALQRWSIAGSAT